MNKALQEKANAQVMHAIEKFNALNESSISVKKLRSCNAKVREYDDYFLLVSYSTTVALIDKSTGIMYDFLRWAYGYTSTSAQHISKFAHDYKAVDAIRYYAI